MRQRARTPYCSTCNAALLLLTVLTFLIHPRPAVAAGATTAAGEHDWSTGLAGLDTVNLSDRGRTLLGQNGFVIVPTNKAELADIYADAKKLGQGPFVTTDAVLHTGHVFFDDLLRLLEIDQLSGLVKSLTNRMLDLSKTQYLAAKDPDLKEAARLNLGFFAVAKALFDPTYRPGAGLDALVGRELAHIKDHQGFEFRELLTYVPPPHSLQDTPYAYEDYSQYVPRGHYTRNDQFGDYFKAMMWYGRVDFKLLPAADSDALLEIGRKMTLQALLMTEALVRDPEAMALWRKVYEPTVYFAGKTDDLGVDDYAALAREVFPGTDLTRFADRGKQLEFMRRARQLRAPQILSGAAGNAAATQGFRFMGQRFVPDSHIFQELVFGAAGTGKPRPAFLFTGSGEPFTMGIIPDLGPVRVFPRGLDVMAVFGSKRALEILGAAGDTAYTDYAAQFALLAKLYGATSAETWNQNLYWRWLHALLPLLEERQSAGTQPFQTSPAWRDKELLTALGSWTELRHDTILYAKQSYTGMPKSIPWEPERAYGYVEPAPEVYGRLANLCADLRGRLGSLGLAGEGIPQKLEAFEALLARLRTMAAEEVAGQPLSEAEYASLDNFGEELEALTRFPDQVMARIASEADTRMELVADVHTDPAATQSVLEEGIGAPADIYVRVRDDRSYRVCRGGVFSYYEFKQPMNHRLTDEAWQQLGRDGKRPAQPAWIGVMSQ